MVISPKWFMGWLPIAVLMTGTAVPAKDLSETKIAELSLGVFASFGDGRRAAIKALVETGDKSLIPTFVLAMRMTGDDADVRKALAALTGEIFETWHDAFDWQEAHPDIVPHNSFRPLKLKFITNTDARFSDFFSGPNTTRDTMKIRLEEIVWGGVTVDGIPPLGQPEMITAEAASYLLDDDLVFGIEINGDARAYPLRIMGWHEMMNDKVGGVPLALAYCTLCAAAIVFETEVKGREAPLIFSSSGLLFRSNKLMYDRETKSLWNQFTGEPVVGPLTNHGLVLKTRPIVTTSWASWRAAHPDTTVLSLETGWFRDYGSGVTYNEYFASPDLMFPSRVKDERNALRKDYVFGIRSLAASKAWPIEAFRKQPVINDRVGAQAVVLIGDAETRTVRAYQRGEEEFRLLEPNVVVSGSETWRVGEGFLISDNGKRLPRVAGHVSYWFAWDSYLGAKSELYGAKE